MTELRILLVHPGTQYAPRLAAELERAGALQCFATGIGFAAGGWIDRMQALLPAGWRRLWANRRIDGVSPSRLVTFPLLELAALRRLRRGEPSEKVFRARNEAFQHAIPDRWILEATHVVGFDTSSWILAERCRRLERPFILDQSIGHPKAKEGVYASLRRDFPEWSESIPEKKAEDIDLEHIEHRLATRVVVPSGFVRRTLVRETVPETKIRVIPFGTDLELFSPGTEKKEGKLVFLFVGSLSARKGVPVLLNAWTVAGIAERAELWFAGGGMIPDSARMILGVRWLGAVSRQELADIMREAEVLVCPSFFEGLAQVQLEALAACLPVIGTTSSGAEEVVSDGETGFIVQPGDTAELARVLLRLADDGGLRRRMHENCVAQRERLSWQVYGARWLNLLRSVDGPETAGTGKS